MPMRIRLAMHGLRHNRIFHIVAVNQNLRRNARPTELLGVYNPRLPLGQDHKIIEWSVDRIKYWLGVGAIPSKAVVSLLEMVGVCLPIVITVLHIDAIHLMFRVKSSHQTPNTITLHQIHQRFLQILSRQRFLHRDQEYFADHNNYI